MTIQKRLEAIKSKLADLKVQDKEMKVWGAGDDLFFRTIGHHYDLKPVVSEAEMVAIEKKLGITVPEEMRAFYTQVGNGGAGPAWGLFQLEYTFPEEEFLKDYPQFCSMTCDYGDDYANGIKGQLDKDPRYMEKVEGFGGFLKLADYGHGMTAYMVVGGDQQVGKMWFLLEDGDVLQIAPMVKKGEDWQMSFLDWYEGWLEDCFKELKK